LLLLANNKSETRFLGENIRFDFSYVFSSQFRFSDENKSKWKSKQKRVSDDTIIYS